jgi:N-acetylglutamate synthase-like GNAT family acetyltransferase
MNAHHTLTRSVPSPNDLQFLEDRLYEFNSGQTGQDDGQIFGFFIRNAQDEIVAGCCGWTWAQACQIQSLWVHSSWRRHDYERTLLESAENEARERNCKVVLIGSYSFQFPAFYQKCGYELAWQLNDFPPSHQRYYLSLSDASGQKWTLVSTFNKFATAIPNLNPSNCKTGRFESTTSHE